MNGVLYPAKEIQDWFDTSDILHISNEVSVWADCPRQPTPNRGVFCSDPSYWELLKHIHTGVIENTGNHLNDYGWEPSSYTLGIYEKEGIPYFGGGRTLTEATRYITLTHNGNVLAFAGCNPVGPAIGWVDGLDDGRPGSAPCASPCPELQEELKKAKTSGAVVFSTLPILAARGQDVYVAYNHAQKIWVSASHDGGETFSSVSVKQTGVLGWALAFGGTMDPAGNVYISWAGSEQNGGAKGPMNLFISKSTDGGKTWTNQLIDISGSPPDCSEFLCGWAFLGAQLTLASDASGTLYALWSASGEDEDQGPERMYFARSCDAGQSWSPEEQVSAAPEGANHAFPAITAGFLCWLFSADPAPLREDDSLMRRM